MCVLLALGVSIEELRSSQTFLGDFLQQFHLKGSEPGLAAKAGEYGDLALQGVADPVMEESAVEHVRIVLDVLPVPESVITDPLQQLVTALNQHHRANRIGWLVVLGERFLE